MPPTRATLCLLLSVLAPACAGPPNAASAALAASASITAAEIQAHVDLLAQDDWGGRPANDPATSVVTAFLADQFERAGLQPLGDDGGWFQQIDDPKITPNVVAMLPGSGPGFVLLTAHYDHLAPASEGDDRIFNGADDNGSGTAAVLELAQAFAQLPQRPRASIVFVAFTAEELGLAGSRFFVDNPPIPLDEIRAVVNLDMISRGGPNLIFCEGCERAPALRSIVDRANANVGLEIRFDEHPEWFFGSDHMPFMKRQIPTLYFGVEDHVDYHKVTDHADRILAELAAKVARLTFLIAYDVAQRQDG